MFVIEIKQNDKEIYTLRLLSREMMNVSRETFYNSIKFFVLLFPL